MEVNIVVLRNFSNIKFLLKEGTCKWLVRGKLVLGFCEEASNEELEEWIDKPCLLPLKI